MGAEDWTEDRVTRAKELWADGFSASQIAADLNCGFSRVAIIGKLSRLGCFGKKSTVKRQSYPEHRRPRSNDKPRPTTPNILAHNLAERTDRLKIAPGLPASLEEPAVGSGIQHHQLENNTCRWPFGHPGEEPFYFCGDPSADLSAERPYCPFHTIKSRERVPARRSYVPEYQPRTNGAKSW